MQNQPQDSTPHLSSYRSSHHHPSLYFFEFPPMRVFLSTFWSMICCLRSSSRQAMQTTGYPKQNNLLIPFDGILLASSSFVFIQFRRDLFNFFARSNRDVLFIYLQFCNPRQVIKIFFDLFFLHFKKAIIIIIAQHTALLVFYIGVFTLFNIYLRKIIFASFVYRINL